MLVSSLFNQLILYYYKQLTDESKLLANHQLYPITDDGVMIYFIVYMCIVQKEDRQKNENNNNKQCFSVVTLSLCDCVLIDKYQRIQRHHFFIYLCVQPNISSFTITGSLCNYQFLGEFLIPVPENNVWLFSKLCFTTDTSHS